MKFFTLFIALLALAATVATPAAAQVVGANSPYDYIRYYVGSKTPVQADSVTTNGTGACSTSVYWFGELIPYGHFNFRFVSRDSQVVVKDSTFIPWAYYKFAYKDVDGATKYALDDSSKSALTEWKTIKYAAADSIKLKGRSHTWLVPYDFRTKAPDGVLFKFAGCLARDTGSTIVRVKAANPLKDKNVVVY